jgi:hypothetical protein
MYPGKGVLIRIPLDSARTSYSEPPVMLPINSCYMTLARDPFIGVSETLHPRHVGTNRRMRRLHTLNVMVPLIEAINMMLLLLLNHTFHLHAACAVNSTPFVLMLIA